MTEINAPIIAAPKPNRRLFGRIGFLLSLIPWLVFLLSFFIHPRVDSPMGALFELAPLAALAALILSLIGVFRDSRKGWAIGGLVLSLIIIMIIVAEVCLCCMMQ